MLVRLIVGMLLLQACTLSYGQDERTSVPPDRSLPRDVIEMPIGVTRSGTPIVSWITPDDLDVNSPKLRILLVAGVEGSTNSASVVKDLLRRFYDTPEFKRYRDRVTLSAIVDASPDRTATIGSYPPTGDYYSSLQHVESQFIWRWIGMHAPDRVIELVSSEHQGFIDRDSRPADSLARQLDQVPAADVGLVPGLAFSLKAGSMHFDKLLADSLFQTCVDSKILAGFQAARIEQQRRAARAPRLIAEQLAKVYGHALPTVAYIPAVACLGRLRLARLTGDTSTVSNVERIAEDFISGDTPTLTDKSSGSDIAGHILWGELHADHPLPCYVALAQAAADVAFDSQGKPLEAMPTHSEMSDAVFMGCPILAQVGKLTGQSRYYEMCLTHMRFMNKLNLRSDGLHRHSPQDETAWGRGNGFPALGLALVLEYMPEDCAQRPEIMAVWQAHLRALLKHQDVTGAWHQVIDHPESYRELSCTCMITYAMASGVRHGWLPKPEFAAAVERGWQAIKLRIAADGGLVDVCTGTGKMRSLREYLERPAILGRDARGGAMALLVATEMMQWPGPTHN